MARLAQLTLGASGLRSISAVCNPAWTYGDFSGWDSIGMCDHDSDQSPIDIQMSQVADTQLAPLDLVSGDPGSARLTLNEHTWEVDFADSATTITWNGRSFSLTQFHFHAPSEHTIDGKHYDMELHNVFTHTETGQNLVVGFFMKDAGQDAGPRQTYFDTFWSHFPSADGSTPMHVSDPFSLLMPDPSSAAYLHYTGSLTTPPCTNETIWILLQEPITVNSEFVTQYREGINAPNCTQLADHPLPEGVANGWDTSLGDNNRNLQHLGGRTVGLFTPSATPAAEEQQEAAGGTGTTLMVLGGLILATAVIAGVLYTKNRKAQAQELKEPFVALA